MISQSAFGLSVLLLLFASGMAYEPVTNTESAVVATAPAGFVALDGADLAELELAELTMSEATLAEARGEVGDPGDDGIEWEYLLLFGVIAAAMAAALALN